jgi:two-component system NtrC family sensor kinase
MERTMNRRRYISIRTKLIASFLAVILFGGILSLSFGWRLVHKTILSQAQDKVRHDLKTAWIVYEERLSLIQQTLLLTSRREIMSDLMSGKNYATLATYLKKIKRDNALDILTLTDGEGAVVLRIDGGIGTGDSMADNPLVRRALEGTDASGSIVLRREEILGEAPGLAERAEIPFVPTMRSTQTPEAREGSGLFQMAAVPILGPGGTVLGVLYGGNLLNRSNEIVDGVKEAVYEGAKYRGDDIGTATIFLYDLRIATNVMGKGGRRAIGTLVSDEVAPPVLKEGRRWVGRAFVVDDWYITSYDPIRDPDGRIVGMLYVGMLERPYIDSVWRVMFTFTGIGFLCVILLLVILFFSTTSIVRPLQKMVEATEKISRGDLSSRVDVTSRDEIGYLAISFNRMTENLSNAKEELVDWGTTLEKKVDERTSALVEMQQQMIQSEKLASLGKLSASIAHEINNPLGGILIYAHLIQEDMKQDDPAYENLSKIIKETTRCKNIVKDLLEFARSKEPRKEIIDLNRTLERALDIVEKQAAFQDVRIHKQLAPDLPAVVADANQLQQVFLNIIINGCEAMDGKGDLTLTTAHDSRFKTVSVGVRDTGCGMSSEVKGMIFEPFFTTKEVGKGTGLGLSVSYGIITKHQGTISVDSEPGKGATFTVTLPVGTGKDEELGRVSRLPGAR